MIQSDSNIMLENVRQSYSLSPMQEGILFHYLLDQDSGIYIEQIIGELEEKMDIVKFQKSWQKIVVRHPILRTSFSEEEGNKPIQIVHEEVELTINLLDWRDLSPKDQDHQFTEYLNKDRKQGFDITQAPLMRLALFQLEENSYKMLWTFHHILLDGRSFNLILKELFILYEALCRNEAIELIEPRPYQEYINWLNRQDLEKSKKFWQSQLKGFTTPTPLPIIDQHYYKERIPKERYIEECRLSENITKQLSKLATENEITLSTICQGIWSLLLSRYSGEKDILFGAVRACRHTLEGSESMIGLLINTLPVRIKINPHQPVILLLKEIRKQWLELRDYEYSPLAKIKQWSEVVGNIGLFDSLFMFENYEFNTELRNQGENWHKRKFQLLEQINYPLAIGFYGGKQLLIKINYDCHLFEKDAIVRMLGHLNTLLEGIVEQPQQKVSHLPLLTKSEKQQILIDWNDTKVDYPKDKCIHQLFEEQVIKTPDNIAIVFEDQQLTYKELNEKSNQLAHYLQRWGVKPETLVGICLDKSLAMIIGILGILKAGGAYAPLDPNYPQERLNFMVEDSQIAILLTQQELGLTQKFKGKTIINLDQDWQLIDQENRDNLVSLVKSNNLAYVIYTSGSTGQPKGVMIEHQGAVNTIYFRITKQFHPENLASVPFSISISFDGSVAQLFSTLAVGGKVTIIDNIFEVDKFNKTEKFTIILATPSLLEKYLADYQLSNSIKLVCVGGEKITNQLIEKLNQYPNIKKYNIYGPTEASIFCSFNEF